jgi:hypothetical protein
MFSRDIEVLGMTKEPGEVRGEQANQSLASSGVSVLRRAEQRIQPVAFKNAQPRATSVKDFAVAVDQFDTGQTQRQLSRLLKLFARQHSGSHALVVSEPLSRSRLTRDLFNAVSFEEVETFDELLL